MDYVANHYTGKKDKMSIRAAFGLSAKELGRKVEVFALRVSTGWRPE